MVVLPRSAVRPGGTRERGRGGPKTELITASRRQWQQPRLRHEGRAKSPRVSGAASAKVQRADIPVFPPAMGGATPVVRNSRFDAPRSGALTRVAATSRGR